jgi:formylmethanofuran dehydrogenase subunit E
VNLLNFVEEPKQRIYDDILKERAIEFHGHDGPYMAIGLRMGLAALKMLDCKGWFDLECEVRLNWSPPDSCVIDGIQSSTGCTMGKKNINVVEQTGVTVSFRSEQKELTLVLKSEVISNIKNKMMYGDIPHELIEELEEAELDELFEISLCSNA